MESEILSDLEQQHQALTRALDRSLKHLKGLHAQRRFLKREYELLKVRLDATTDPAEREALQRQLADLTEALAVRLQVLNEHYQPAMQLERDLEELEDKIAALSSQRQAASLGATRRLLQAKLLVMRLGTSLRRRQASRG